MAAAAARAGARVLLEGGLARRPGETKSPGNFVTEADRNSEAEIVEVLAREAPGIPILAEEAGGTPAGTMWAVDPLDGTTNFMRGLPVVGVSVALLRDGEPEVGVVIAPWLTLEFMAQRGHGATLNGDPLPRLGPGDLSAAVLATGFPFKAKDRLGRYLSVLEPSVERFEDLRRMGAAALDLSWTAAGNLDGFFELGLAPWDVAAGATLVLETGGVVSDWSGGPGWLQSGDILAAAPAIHEKLVELAGQPREG
ncbi:MAG: inositol monophosphatase [Candidatus Dormibacteraeota bacterium]|nr:inositol monophosphatase [Candidatus Dormibacteraeota bacterium]